MGNSRMKTEEERKTWQTWKQMNISCPIWRRERKKDWVKEVNKTSETEKILKGQNVPKFKQRLPDISVGKESASNVGDLGSIPRLGKSPGEGKGYPLQCSGLENSMDCTVQRVTKTQAQLSDFHFTERLLNYPGTSSTEIYYSMSSLILRSSLSVQFSLVDQLCLTLCNPIDCSTPGYPVHHKLLELAQTHVHRVSDAIWPPHPLSFSSPPAFNFSQHQGLFEWISSSHQVAKVLEFQLQHQSSQWIFRTDFL